MRQWCAQPFGEFRPPAGLKNAEKELTHSGGSVNDHLLGLEVGTVKAVYAIGNSAIAMGNAAISPPARLGNWLANTISEPAVAVSDSASFGKDVGKSIAAIIQGSRVAEHYLTEVKQEQAKGNYAKPITDAAHELHSVADKFKALSPAQQTATVSEHVVSAGVQIATGKILASASEALAAMREKMDSFELKSTANRLHFGVEKVVSENTRVQPELKEFRSPEHFEASEKHFAGASKSRFGFEEIDKVRDPSVPIQCHDNACVAAVGEMLTGGKIDQHTLAKELDLYLLPHQRDRNNPLSLRSLAQELGSDWQYMGLSDDKGGYPTSASLLDELLKRHEPFGVTLHKKGLQAHAVVVDGTTQAGLLVVRDPAEGTICKVEREQFVDAMQGLAVAKRKNKG